MFAFVFPLGSTYFSQSDRTKKDTTEVTKDKFYGKPVTNFDIEQARFERQVANAFVTYSLTSVEFRFAQFPQEYIDNYYGFGPTRDEEAIKDALRLAQKADEFGIKVSDDVVRAWIKEITSGKLTTEMFQEVIARVGRMAEGLSAETVFDILRKQLRIQLAGGLAMGRVRYGALQVTPYEAWQFYRRLNDKFGFDVIPVAVADFTSQINDPGDDALRELYRKHVGQLPDPSSPEPGFKVPRKLNLQYASVKLEDFTLAMTGELEITEEEIAEYYESHKDLYRVMPTAEPPAVGPAEIPEKPTSELPKPEVPAKDNPEPRKDDAEPKKESPEKPSSGESSTPKEGNSEDDIECDDPPAKSADQQEPKKQETNDASKNEEKSSPDEPGKKSESAQEPAKDSSTKDDAKDGQKPDGDAAKPDETAMPGEKKDEPQYKPLEEVSKEIRDIIRKDKSRAELTKRLEQIDRTVSDFGVKVYLRAKDNFDIEKETNPDAVFVPPVPPDFAKSASELGLQFAETGRVSLDEEFAKISGLGEAMELRGDRLTGRMVPEVMSATDLYDPVAFRTFNDEYFAVWKVGDEAEREPDFADVREKVLAAYQSIKARDLAKEHATKLADSLRSVNGDIEKFREQNPNIKTLAFGPISLWSNAPSFSMNTMGRPGRVHPTDLPGLQFPTDELRTNTFKLKEGEVTVAANQPQDNYYILLVTKREESSLEEFARARTLIEDQVLQEQLEKTTAKWLQALRDEFKKPARNIVPAGN
jgi:parvulin-like peptidyl-prolyl isomerase